jgi:hypothetical protein
MRGVAWRCNDWRQKASGWFKPSKVKRTHKLGLNQQKISQKNQQKVLTNQIIMV